MKSLRVPVKAEKLELMQKVELHLHTKNLVVYTCVMFQYLHQGIYSFEVRKQCFQLIMKYLFQELQNVIVTITHKNRLQNVELCILLPHVELLSFLICTLQFLRGK